MKSHSFREIPKVSEVAAPLFHLDLKQSLRRHKSVAVAVTVLLMVASGYLILKRKPFNYAESIVFVSPSKASLTGDSFSPQTYEALLQQEMHLVTERATLQLILREPEFANYPLRKESEAETISRLQGSIFVGRVEQSYRFSIGMESRNRMEVADQINAVTHVFLLRAQKLESDDSEARVAALTKQRQDLEQKLNDTLVQQSALNRRMGIAVADVLQTNRFDAETERLRDQLMQAQAERGTAQATLNTLSGPSGNSTLIAASDEAIANDAGLSGLKNSLAQRRAALIQQMVGMSISNPLYQQNQEELKKLDDAQDQLHSKLEQQAARRLQDKARGDLQRTQTMESDLLTRLATKQAQAGNASQPLQEAIGMGQDVQRFRAQYASLDARIQALDVDSSGPPAVRLVESAVTPLSSVSDRNKKLLELIFFFSWLAGLAVACILNALDQRIHKVEDVMRVAGFGVMGVLLDHHDYNKKFSDEYNFRLAGALEDAVRRGGSRVFLVTGDRSEVGTSETLRELARTLASFGRKVLAMDASGRTPPVAYYAKGTADESTAGPADIERRSALPERDQNAINGMLERYLKTYEIVLIDSPPILTSADTEYLARVVDGTVLVVGCGISRKRELQRSLNLLSKLGVLQVGIVLTRVGDDCADDDLASDIAALRDRLERKPLNSKWLNEQIALSMTAKDHRLRPEDTFSEEAALLDSEELPRVETAPVNPH